MKSFVIVKKFDSLGRVVIPKNVRKHYGFEDNCMVQVIPQENGVLIVLEKANKNKSTK